MDNQKKQFKQLLYINTILGTLGILTAIFWIQLRVSLWILIGLFDFCLWFFILAYGLKSLIFAIKTFKQFKNQALIPLLILIISSILIISTDTVFTDFYLRFLPDGQRVVNTLSEATLTEQSIIQVDIDIPVARRIVAIQEKQALTVLFTRFTANFGDVSIGYIYRSDNFDHLEQQYLTGSSLTAFKKMKNHWFFGDVEWAPFFRDYRSNPSKYP